MKNNEGDPYCLLHQYSDSEKALSFEHVCHKTAPNWYFSRKTGIFQALMSLPIPPEYNGNVSPIKIVSKFLPHCNISVARVIIVFSAPFSCNKVFFHFTFQKYDILCMLVKTIYYSQLCHKEWCSKIKTVPCLCMTMSNKE